MATALALELRQPAQHTVVAVTRTMRAAFAGNFEEADQNLERFQRGVGVPGTLGGVDETTFSYVAQIVDWARREQEDW